MVQLIDGSRVAREIRREVKDDIFATRWDRPPVLGVVLANSNPASESYVSKKMRACEEVGIECRLWDRKNKIVPHDYHGKPDRLARESPRDYVRHCVREMSTSYYHGIIIQLPVDDCESQNEFFSMVDPFQDVDCFHPENVGLVCQGTPRFLPCTPAGIIELLKRSDISVKGRMVTIINNSNIVGKPLAMMLTQEGATVALCHKDSAPQDVVDLCGSSDIIVVAVGKPCFLNSDYVSRKTTVIDVGITRRDGKIVGDCDPEIYEIVRAYTPVPGGVGPMTVAMLMRNVLQAARLHL